MLPAEIKRIIDRARDSLVGKIPDPKGQVDQITSALIYKFMDDLDQAAILIPRGKPSFFIDDMERFAWHNLFVPQISNQQKTDLYIESISNLSKAEHLPPLFRDIFKDAFVPFRAADTISLFLNEINQFPPYQKNSEDLGNAFEYLLHFMGTQGDAGQFRTPRHIIDFIVDVVAPTKSETILDPACGTAGFLVSAYKFIIKTSKDITQKETTTLAKNIRGVDIDPQMAKIARVNLYLHKFNTPEITEDDTLTNENLWGKKYNVILANPPFMTPTGGIKPHDKFGIMANRSEVLFVDYIAEHLRLQGRAGIIVPEGIIFQSAKAYKELRKKLIKDWGLYAVVSLPSGVFNPYSGVKTSILFLDRGFSSNDILFVKIENDGLDLGAQRRKIDKNDLPAALSVIQQWKQKQTIPAECEALAHNVSKEKIAKNEEYNFTGGRYRETVDYRNAKWSMVELGEICEIYQPKTITSKQIKNSGRYKVFGANGIIGYFDEYNHEESEIAVTCRGATCGTVNLTDPQSWITGNAMVVKPKKEPLDKKYLFYLLKNSDLNSTISGTAQPQITRAGISPYKIPMPPLDVQEQIAAEIDSYQKVMDGAKQVVTNWKPQIKVNPDWPMVNLGEENLFQIESGGTPSTNNEKFWNGDNNWATLVDLPASDFITELVDTKRKITKKGLENSSAKLLPKNSILISSRATIGRIAINRVVTATNQGFKNIIILNNKKVDVYFLALCISRITDNLEAMGEGSTYKEFSKSNLKSIKIPLPSLKVQEQIVAEIESEQQIITANKTLIAKMEQKIADKIGEIWGKKT